MNEIYHEWNMRMRDMSSRAPAWSRAGPNQIHLSEIYQRYYYYYINQQASYKTYDYRLCSREREEVCVIVNTAMEPDTAADFTVENVEKVK